MYHHVTGVDASSSASLAAYINTLAYKEFGPSATTKTLEGTYWYAYTHDCVFSTLADNSFFPAATMPSPESICACMPPFLVQ